MKKLILCLILALFSIVIKADTAGLINAAMQTREISREDAKAIYLMKARHWDDGETVILFQMPQSSRAHKSFVRDVLRMTPEQYSREWDRIVNSGLSTSIRIVMSEAEMIDRVANTPNALGYIDTDHLIAYAGYNQIVLILKIN